ncbi:MAG: polysaccharide deacetylase family protein [Chloroflexota bacterium]
MQKLRRAPIILAFAAIWLVIALNASAVRSQHLATPTQAIALVSLTPTHPAELQAAHTPTLTSTSSPTQTAASTQTFTATPTPTHTPSLTPTPWPIPDSNARTREVKVPILMYHHVGPLPASPDKIRIGLTILPDYFEAQLKFLQERGYTSIDFYQMQYALALGQPLPAKPILFTFDDAYEDVYQFAFPLMKKYGFTGTVFVPTQFLDEGRVGYMNWDQAKELADAGWRLEPHTKDHVEVKNRPRDFLVYQIYGSMETLRFHLGYQPRFFAYPSGEYDDKAIEILKEVGYWGAVTTDASQYHRFANAYAWGRVRVSGNEVLADLANRLGEKYP